VWPAGLLLIYLRRRPLRLGIVWIGSALLTAVIYFVGFDFNVTQSSSHDPAAMLSFFVRVVGDILGQNQPGVMVTLFGSVLVVTAIWVLARFAISGRTSTGGRPFALSLLLFGLLFSALTALGRSGLGAFGFDIENRYTVFAIFVLVGLYLSVLDPPVASELRSSKHDTPPPTGMARRQWQIVSDSLFPLARVIVGVGIVLTVLIGSVNGRTQAREIHQNRLYLGKVTVRASQYPDTIVNNLDWLEHPQSIRSRITIARDHHLSLFGTADGQRYLSEKPLNLYSTPLRASVTLPRNGSTLHGKQILDVGISDQFDVKTVDYILSGPGRQGVPLAIGHRSNYGWIGGWNTSTVPNGTYTIVARVSDSGGRSIMTIPVEVRVEN